MVEQIGESQTVSSLIQEENVLTWIKILEYFQIFVSDDIAFYGLMLHKAIDSF